MNLRPSQFPARGRFPGPWPGGQQTRDINVRNHDRAWSQSLAIILASGVCRTIRLAKAKLSCAGVVWKADLHRGWGLGGGALVVVRGGYVMCGRVPTSKLAKKLSLLIFEGMAGIRSRICEQAQNAEVINNEDGGDNNEDREGRVSFILSR